MASVRRHVHVPRSRMKADSRSAPHPRPDSGRGGPGGCAAVARGSLAACRALRTGLAVAAVGFAAGLLLPLVAAVWILAAVAAAASFEAVRAGQRAAGSSTGARDSGRAASRSASQAFTPQSALSERADESPPIRELPFGVEGRAPGEPAVLPRVHSLLRGLDEAVLVVDRDYRIALANPAADRLLRVQGDTRLHGLDFERIFGEGRGEAARAFAAVHGAVHALLEGERPDAGATRGFQGVPYEGRLFDVVLEPLDDDGERSVVVVARDVTAENESERLKHVFLSTISHELNTPLTNICAYTELLGLVDPADDEWREFLGVVESESHRLARRVQSLLDYTRLRADEVRWSIEPVPVQRLLGEVQRMFQERFDGAGVTLRIVGPECVDSISVLADRAWLIRCLSELLDNALKFARHGEVVLRYDVAAGCGTIRVEDDGPGITSAERERVFSELHQLGDVATGKPDGLGLGLAIARAAAEGMGGRLEVVEPADGSRGAAFVLGLPTPQEAEVVAGVGRAAGLPLS
jgi:signal transduction histidine kinase